ncbi:MOSC domain-containing protein [Roseibaca sp. Y0-43]|uniref:MOSC domain-containing protein n=1 Tax=Roseibaca sp. Y0-43 TaxID=2816854 RepID=UPI001D0C93BB|nr:MOSC domain-containing protein [Roseibaca sp. Y0-43]MCC1482482.1 MOSC domain-containing protein [Roseibaca sp. Y0-43]
MGWRLAHIFRHPIKAHGRERLDAVDLTEGRCLPLDRHWAVAHDAAMLMPGWNPCMNFTRGAKTSALQAINAAWDGALLTLTHPDLAPLTFDPDTPEGEAAFLAWVRPLHDDSRAGPAKLVKAGRGMTDTDFESVSILNLASNEALGAQIGADLGLDRWRANLWLDGMEAWAERNLIGRELRIGDARLRVVEPIGRCRATMVDCATGQIDHDTLKALRIAGGDTNFGVYATVIQSGPIRAGDVVELVA